MSENSEIDKTGNETLAPQELIRIKGAVITKYLKDSGIERYKLEKKFNTNLENYNEICQLINSRYPDENYITPKPLSKILGPKEFNSPKSFRINFIRQLYHYAFGRTLGEIRKEQYSNRGRKENEDSYFLLNAQGHWKCYYTIDRKFAENYKNGREALINISDIKINPGTTKILFFHNWELREGNIKPINQNAFITIYEKEFLEPGLLTINFQRPDPHYPLIKLEYGAGIFQFIHHLGYPVACKCVLMRYDDGKKFEVEIDKEIINLHPVIDISSNIDHLLLNEKFISQLNFAKEFFLKGNNNLDIDVRDINSLL